jgi:hypothetical protein
MGAPADLTIWLLATLRVDQEALEALVAWATVRYGIAHL